MTLWKNSQQGRVREVLSEGIRNWKIEKERDSGAPSEVVTYFLSPKELAKYRAMELKNNDEWDNSYKAHLEFEMR